MAKKNKQKFDPKNIPTMARVHKSIAEQADVTKPMPQNVTVTVESNLICEQPRTSATITVDYGICPRCKGDGRWHSTKTGVRALTSSEPLVDETKPCPDCGGSGKK
jgi:DnaJ-class molecular chaperone